MGEGRQPTVPQATLVFDARGITAKHCGVRNVTENYLRELARHFDVLALINPETEHLIDDKIARAIAPRFCSRFGVFSDIWISYLVLKYRPMYFFSAHSFLPPCALMPRRRAFICHDLFAAFDKTFFAKRGALAPLIQLVFRLLSEISFYRASLVIAPSETIRRSFSVLTMRAKREMVLHNGIAIDRAVLNVPERRKEILFVGNFRGYKGFDIMRAAWQGIVRDPLAAAWKLVVVTNESEAHAQRYFALHGCLNRAEVHCCISDDALAQIRARVSICVVPSRDEGFGIPLLEAVGAGGLVIHSDIPVFKEITDGLSNSVIRTFAVGRADRLTEVLREAVGQVDRQGFSPLQREAMLGNRAWVRKQYSWKAAGARLATAIEAL